MRVAVWLLLTFASFILSAARSDLRAQSSQSAEADNPRSELADALTPAEWKKVDAALERALAWMAIQQQQDGSFPTIPSGQPAITSLCVMAFLSCGHQPGSGQYGEQLNRAIGFVLDCQQPSGLFVLEEPERGQRVDAQEAGEGQGGFHGGRRAVERVDPIAWDGSGGSPLCSCSSILVLPHSRLPWWRPAGSSISRSQSCAFSPC